MSEEKPRELREAAPEYDEYRPIKVRHFPAEYRVERSDAWKSLRGSVLEEGDIISPLPDVWKTEV